MPQCLHLIKTAYQPRRSKSPTELREDGPVFAPSATKMQETLKKMPAANVYLLEKTHFLQFFVADSVPGSIIIGRGR